MVFLLSRFHGGEPPNRGPTSNPRRRSMAAAAAEIGRGKREARRPSAARLLPARPRGQGQRRGARRVQPRVERLASALSSPRTSRRCARLRRASQRQRETWRVVLRHAQPGVGTRLPRSQAETGESLTAQDMAAGASVLAVSSHAGFRMWPLFCSWGTWTRTPNTGELDCMFYGFRRTDMKSGCPPERGATGAGPRFEAGVGRV